MKILPVKTLLSCFILFCFTINSIAQKIDLQAEENVRKEVEKSNQKKIETISYVDSKDDFSNDNWANKMTINLLEVREVKTKKILKQLEIEGEITINLIKEEIKISFLADGLKNLFEFSFNKDEVKDYAEKTDAYKYNKILNVYKNGEKWFVMTMKEKDTKLGVFMLVNANTMYMFSFEQE